VSEFHVDSFLCCFGLQILVLLFVDLSYELFVVSDDFEQFFLH
jgi:hypothetical protein